MAAIKQHQLTHLTNKQIHNFYIIEDIKDCKISIIKDYVSKGKDSYELSSRINRVERLLNNIIINRFIKGEIK